MQVCCGSGERTAIIEETKAAYPECHLENVHGKT